MQARLIITDETALTGRVLGTDTLVRFPTRFTTKDRRLVGTGDIVDAQIWLHASGTVNAQLQRRIARIKNELAAGVRGQ